MFKTIRSKIAWFNVATLIAFLFFFIVAIILIIYASLNFTGENYLRQSAEEIIKGEEVSNRPVADFHQRLGYGYILWNKDKSVDEQSINSPGLVEQAYGVLDEGRNNYFSSVNSDDQSYRVYTTKFEKLGKTYYLQVFQDLYTENAIISYVVTILLAIGLLGFICLLPISNILAGRALIPVKKSFEDQKQFIADASHELRSPLTVVRTSLEVLNMKENETIGENKKWIDNIELEADNMSHLITQLLWIAQAENQKLFYNDQNEDLSSIVKEVVMLMEPNAEDNDIDLISFIDENINFYGDQDKLVQLFRIFVDNAIKYTPDGGEITVELTQDKKNVVFTITDTGVGIAKEEMEQIFDRFYRCDNARKRGAGGSGLGLNIARSIVENYNGKIITESELNKGTTFKIELPKTAF